MITDRGKNSKIRLFLGGTVGLVILCVTVSIITSHLMKRSESWSHHDEVGGHEWLHKELNLTQAEADAVDAFEPEYRQKREALQHQFQGKIEKLRKEITESEQFSDEIEATIHELHVYHSQLQELSIQHYFQMMSVLPPEKQNKLRDLAGKALSVPQ